MTYEFNTVKIVCDSTYQGSRITTFVLTYPRYIHAELLTHRSMSRNAQSSRAIPAAKRIERVRSNPVMPIRWGANQRGMQAKEESVERPDYCEVVWRQAAAAAATTAEALAGQNLHKQWVNRVLEPFDTITTVVTATDWGNFFGLRCHPDAQPEIADLAWKMADLYYYYEPKSVEDLGLIPDRTDAPRFPEALRTGDWHLPFLDEHTRAKLYDSCTDSAELASSYVELAKLSVARCARVSYLTHEGSTPDVEKDLALHDMLLSDGHMSPFEHQAVASDQPHPASNFGGRWKQYRKMLVKPELRTFDYVQALQTRART